MESWQNTGYYRGANVNSTRIAYNLKDLIAGKLNGSHGNPWSEFVGAPSARHTSAGSGIATFTISLDGSHTLAADICSSTDGRRAHGWYKRIYRHGYMVKWAAVQCIYRWHEKHHVVINKRKRVSDWTIRNKRMPVTVTCSDMKI
jgi:hypothetical protein